MSLLGQHQTGIYRRCLCHLLNYPSTAVRFNRYFTFPGQNWRPSRAGMKGIVMSFRIATSSQDC